MGFQSFSSMLSFHDGLAVVSETIFEELGCSSVVLHLPYTRGALGPITSLRISQPHLKLISVYSNGVYN